MKVPGVKQVGRKRQHTVPENPKEARMVVSHIAKEAFKNQSDARKVVVPHKKPISVEYVAMRVKEIVRRPRIHAGNTRWLIIEKLKDGTFKYYVSKYEENIEPDQIVLGARQRYKVEQGYQQLKEELGLDHFEGRSWQGLHHHIALCFMAFDFLQSLVTTEGRGKK